MTEKQAFWLAHLRGWARTGGAMVDYCNEHDLEPAAFYRWKRRLIELELWPRAQPEAATAEIASEILESGPSLAPVSQLGGRLGRGSQAGIGPLFQAVRVESSTADREPPHAPGLLVRWPNGITLQLRAPPDPMLLMRWLELLGGMP